MYKKTKKLNEGFTIVETLIVLAIAALILMIVLIAVPDLQRSSTNSNITTSADAIGTGIETFESNNDGQLPTGVSPVASSGSISITGASGTAQATAHIQASDNVIFEKVSTTPAEPAYTQGTIYIVPDAECDDVTNGNGTPTYNVQDIAIFYPIETSSSTGTEYCMQE